ncbi:MAG: DUF4349 domain-containing protein [Mucilaginibacter sp.]|uniref:DUF4349 domain-containing protein n=1 Tax=Mucilaginibacter sp. TaxID=1882438 RepID=UPI0032652DC3
MKKEQLTCMALLCSILWMGCSGNKSEHKLSTADTASISSKAESTQDSLKLVKTADMHFKVKDVERSTEDIAALTASCKGMVMHHAVHSTVQKSEDIPLNNDSIGHVTLYNTTADMLVRIPSVQTEQFMNQVSKMAIYIDARNMDVQDRTLDYLATKMKTENRSGVVKDQKEGRVKLKDSTDLLSMKDDIVDRKINNLHTDADVKYSTIALSIYQSNTISKDMVANDDPSAYQLPLIKRIGMAFENGWLVLSELIVMLMNLWPIMLACICGWFGYRYFKNRRVVTRELP